MDLLWLLAFVGASPYVVWNKGFDSGGTDMAHGTILTGDGIVLAGETKGDVLIYKLSMESGDSVWCDVYDNGGTEDEGWDVVTSPNGSFFLGITSNSENPDPQVSVCAFSKEGGFVWVENLGFLGKNGPPSLFCRHEDSCYVAGWYENKVDPLTYNCFLYLFKENGTSKRLLFGPWVAQDAFSGIDVDREGYIYLASSPLDGVELAKYPSDASSLIWVKHYYEGSPLLRGWQCRVAPGQDIFLCGVDSLNFLLLKWNPDGNQLWSKAKIYDLGADEYCRDMAVDSISDCYLAGWQTRDDGEDAALVKTDSAGNLLWSWVDTLPDNQEIEAIEVDQEGYIYLAGSSFHGADTNALIMKVRQPLTITGKVTDSLGNAMKSIPVSVSGDTTLEVTTDNSGNYEITIYNGGSYTLKTNLSGYTFEPSERTYTPLAHREFDQDFENGHWTGTGETTSGEPLSIEITNSGVRFFLPEEGFARLVLYDPSGRIVAVLAEGMYSQGESWIWLPHLENGIYFVKLELGNKTLTKRIVVTLN